MPMDLNRFAGGFMGGAQQGMGLAQSMRQAKMQEMQAARDAEKQALMMQEAQPSYDINGIPATRPEKLDYITKLTMQEKSAKHASDIASRQMAQQNSSKANTLRDEFNNMSKSFQTIAPMYKNIEVAAKDPVPTPQRDMSMIFAYMKILDPNSTVREGEYANAAKAGTFGDRVKVAVNKVESGQLLTPQQRQEFLNSARQVYGNAAAMQKQHIERYTGLSKQLGVDPSLVVYDYGGNTGEEKIDVPGAPPEDYSFLWKKK